LRRLFSWLFYFFVGHGDTNDLIHEGIATHNAVSIRFMASSDTNDLSGACTAKDEVLSGTTENVKSGANKERAPTLPLISDIG